MPQPDQLDERAAAIRRLLAEFDDITTSEDIEVMRMAQDEMYEYLYERSA